MAGRHQPANGADSPQALRAAEFKRQIPQVGTQLGTRDVWVLEAHLAENGNMVALLLIPYTTQPFCTAIVVDERKGSWNYGHYFDNVNEALSDFLERD